MYILTIRPVLFSANFARVYPLCMRVTHIIRVHPARRRSARARFRSCFFLILHLYTYTYIYIHTILLRTHFMIYEPKNFCNVSSMRLKSLRLALDSKNAGSTAWHIVRRRRKVCADGPTRARPTKTRNLLGSRSVSKCYTPVYYTVLFKGRHTQGCFGKYARV